MVLYKFINEPALFYNNQLNSDIHNGPMKPYPSQNYSNTPKPNNTSFEKSQHPIKPLINRNFSRLKKREHAYKQIMRDVISPQCEDKSIQITKKTDSFIHVIAASLTG